MVQIIDSTLRDGEQSPGISFSVQEKIFISQLLIQTGIQYIEVGTPAMGGTESEAITEILSMDLPAHIITWNRALESDIQASLDCGANEIHISTPVSDIQINDKLNKNKKWVKDTIQALLTDLSKKKLKISWGLEDTSRSDLKFVKSLIKLLNNFSLERIRICDTVGILTPQKTKNLIKEIKKHSRHPIEFHAHNDFGMATANSLSAVEAGADFCDTTITGIGERAGNAAFEEIVLALEQLYNINTGFNLKLIKKVSETFSYIIKKEISPWKPIIGDNIFQHESGIHVDGVLKNPETYEAFSPETLGIKRKIKLGKHSGKKALQEKLNALNIQLNDKDCSHFLKLLKDEAVENKTINDSTLIKIYQEQFIK